MPALISVSLVKWDYLVEEVLNIVLPLLFQSEAVADSMSACAGEPNGCLLEPEHDAEVVCEEVRGVWGGCSWCVLFYI